MTEDQEREMFEAAAHAHYLAERSKRQIKDDFEQPATPEQLLWRKPDGEYGVLMFNAAWWAWKVRAEDAAKITRHFDQFASLMNEAAGVVRIVPEAVAEQHQVRHWLPDELEGSALMLRDHVGKETQHAAGVPA